MKTEQSSETKTLRTGVSLLLVGAVLSLLMVAAAFAHRVSVFAYAEGDKIVAEGYFGGKTKAANSLVEIFGSDGTKLLEGKTDVNGVCSFKVTETLQTKGDLKFVLHAGEGHRAEYTLRLADLSEVSKQKSHPVQTHETAESRNGSVEQSTQHVPVADPALLKRVVEQALDAKLEPIHRTLAQQQKILIEQRDKGPTMSEIFGGIGWIVGLVGVAAYFMSRNRVRGK